MTGAYAPAPSDIPRRHSPASRRDGGGRVFFPADALRPARRRDTGRDPPPAGHGRTAPPRRIADLVDLGGVLQPPHRSGCRPGEGLGGWGPAGGARYPHHGENQAQRATGSAPVSTWYTPNRERPARPGAGGV